MSDEIKLILGGIVRHSLTTFGGILVSNGIIKDSAVPGVVGAGMVLAGVAWSWWQKIGQAKVLALIYGDTRSSGSQAKK